MNDKELKLQGSSMDFYRKIIEIAPTGYAYHKILQDQNGIPCDYEFIEVNDAFEKATGFKREQLIGKKVTEIVPDIKNRKFDWINFYGELAINGGERETEQFIRSLNKWYRVNAYSPERGYFITLLNDITKEKNQIDELQNLGLKLEEQNKYNEMLLSTVPSAVFTVDQECRVTSWNTMAESLTGYTKKEILGQSCKVFAVEPCISSCGLLSDDVKKPITCNICTIKNKQGEILIVAKNVDILRDAKGNVIGGIECFGKWDGKECIFGISKDLSLPQAMLDKFNKLFNNNPALMAVSSVTDKKFIDVNNAFLDKLGYSREEIIGRTAKELCLFVDYDKQLEIIRKLEENGRIHDVEFEVRKKDGQTLFGLFSGEIIDNQIEKVFLTVMVDITYKRNAEMEITRISERLRLATNAANVGIWEYDIVNGTLIWDKSMYALYGTSKEMFSGAYEAWENGLHPDDLESSRQNIQDAIKGLRDFNMEFRVVWHDGTIHHIQANAVVLKDLQGNPSKMYGTNWDITEQVLNEEKTYDQIQMQNILMNMASQYINIPLVKVNSTIQQSLGELGRFVKADRTYIFEYDWEKNICNNTYEWVEEGITPQIHELQGVNLDFIPQWVEAHRKGHTMHIADVLALPKNDGVRRILEPQEVKSIITIPMMQGSECVGFVGFDSVKCYHEYSDNEKKLLIVFASMLININTRSILEKNMSDAKEQAEAANLAKSQFLANMSHEIRTPMNGIVGFLELLRTSNLSLEQKEFIREAKAASEVLLYIINDILDFSKIEAGKLSMEKIDFSIRTVIEDAVSLIMPKAEEKKISIHSKVNASVPDEVMGDPSRLRQILSNLISNAVKFTEHGEVSVMVDCIEKENDMAMIRFEVKDTGIGISKESIGNLFQSFNQADATTTRKYGGTGLGLAISKELVKMMGGNISVESIEGEGSTFSFYIRLKTVIRADEPEHINEIINEYNNANATVAINTLKPKILLVEDNEMNQKIVTLMLKSQNMTCDIAKNGRDAYMSARKKDYDIVFMDCQMPVMDGYESTTKIREEEGNQKHTTIIAMTANAMEGDKTKCFIAGMDDYISKPIDFELMFQLIKKYTKHLDVTYEEDDFIDKNIIRFMERTGMGEADAKEIFKEFGLYLPTCIAKIKVSIEQKAFDEIGKLAHQLKGAAGNLRISSIYDVATDLEKVVIEHNIEKCEKLFDELKRI